MSTTSSFSVKKKDEIQRIESKIEKIEEKRQQSKLNEVAYMSSRASKETPRLKAQIFMSPQEVRVESVAQERKSQRRNLGGILSREVTTKS
jgi:hypothetical protein